MFRIIQGIFMRSTRMYFMFFPSHYIYTHTHSMNIIIWCIKNIDKQIGEAPNASSEAQSLIYDVPFFPPIGIASVLHDINSVQSIIHNHWCQYHCGIDIKISRMQMLNLHERIFQIETASFHGERKKNVW